MPATNELDDDDATVQYDDEVESVESYLLRSHAPEPWAHSDDRLHFHELCSQQHAYLQEYATVTGPFATRSSGLLAECFEFEFSPLMSRFVVGAPTVASDEVLVVFLSNGPKAKAKMMVEKNYDNLSPQDIKDNWSLVETAMRAEIRSFYDMDSFIVALREHGMNICTSRWVFKWKLISNVGSVKARLTIRGLQDLQQNMATFAATASRWGQRVVISIGVQFSWELWTADVSVAFLQGLSFSEIAKLTNTEERSVCFTPPTDCARYFQELPGLQSYNPDRDVLRMKKAVYGLKDAPRAWRIKLDLVLRSTGGRPLHTDSSLYVWFEHERLVCVASTHVDDIKGAGVKLHVARILAVLTAQFGTLKMQHGTFEHCGIRHHQDPVSGTTTLCQAHYAAQLKLMDLSMMNLKEPSTELNALQTAQYLSLLGGLSWMAQTRVDVSVYICALQRAAKRPCVEHAVRLCKVVKWVKKKPVKLTYVRMQAPCRITVVSDSAFRKESSSGLAMRGSIIGVTQCSLVSPGDSPFHVLEFFAVNKDV